MSLPSLMKLAADRSLFVGELPKTDWHHHGAPVLLFALSGAMRLELSDGTTAECRTALVDAGVQHRLEASGERLASIYLEPDTAEARALRQTYLRGAGVAFDICSPPQRRDFTERRLRDFDLDALLQRPLCGAPLDTRIRTALRRLNEDEMATPSRTQLAAVAGLSESRFNHLFSEQMGVCFRRYRMWLQLRAAISQWPRQCTLTEAAMQGGFSDAAHFSRAFRDMFGLTPSTVLKGIGQFEVYLSR